MDAADDISARFNARIWTIQPTPPPRPGSERSTAASTVADDRARSSKSKKKVTFQADEFLVSVVEIPTREDSPLLEELGPCHHGRFGSRLSSQPHLRLRSVGRDMDLVTHIRRLSGYGTPAQPGHLCVRGIKQRGTRPASREPLPRQRTVLASAPHSAKRLFPPTVTIYPEKPPAAGLPVTRPRLQQSAGDDKLSSILARYTLRDALKIKAATREKQTESSSCDAGQNERIRIGRGKHIITVASRGLNSGVQMKISGETLSALPRVHASPYRQQRGVRSAADTDKLVASGRTSIRPVRTISEADSEGNDSTVLPKKLYAWQLANGTLHTHVETPCIMQLWDSPMKTAIEPLSPKP
ncbi:hypothetical protein LSAT2_003791 [Lamellibrachia satsuma]|nr:hypothetical protein LSAT2_003791 [Lamellibrachia satsuma]